MCCFSCIIPTDTSVHTTMPLNIKMYKYATPHTNYLLSMSIQAICQNFLETLRVLPICLSELFAHLFLHLWPANMWHFWALSTCEMLCEPRGPIKHENALFSAWWPPPESEGSQKDDSISGIAASHLGMEGCIQRTFSHLTTGDWLLDRVDAECLPKSTSRASPAPHSSLPRGACEAASKEEVWCAWALSINTGVYLWHLLIIWKIVCLMYWHFLPNDQEHARRVSPNHLSS